jgi:hypothetical protein
MMVCLYRSEGITSKARKWVVDEGDGRFDGIRSKIIGISPIMVDNPFPI